MNILNFNLFDVSCVILLTIFKYFIFLPKMADRKAELNQIME